MSTKYDATRRINGSLEEIPILTDLHSSAPEFIEWHRNTRVAIIHTFGDDSRHVKEFVGISFSGAFIVPDDGGNEVRAREAYRSGFSEASAILVSMLKEIEEYWPDDRPPRPISDSLAESDQTVSSKVFLVHGRDGGTKDTVARFLESLGLEVVILQEQASEGRTIIQKFEDHSGVGFAVVLCSPDDVGALASEKDKLHPRPRQNVILELGFFWGRLGRNRVCALLDGDMEMPSDYDGVLYIPIDRGEGWKLTLAREMRAAGMTIDMNLVV